MEILNIFYLVIYWTQNVHNDFIFLCSLQCVQYKCSSVLEVHGCLYKKEFWLRAQPFVHHLLDLFVGPERLASHGLFERPKQVKITGGEYGGCGRHSKDRPWTVATVERAVWGRALTCCNKTPVLRRPRSLDLIAGSRWFFSTSTYIALVTAFPLAV
jgi:hypothetical protein